MARRLDQIDRLMLDRLQESGRMTHSALAALVGRSVPAVTARVRRLEEEGVILGFEAVLSPVRLRQSTTMYAWVDLDRHQSRSFVEFAARQVEVLELHRARGETTHMLKVRGAQDSVQRVLQILEEWPSVRKLRVRYVEETFKESRRLPVLEPNGNGSALSVQRRGHPERAEEF